jgi:nuclear pore complex protein Nup62
MGSLRGLRSGRRAVSLGVMLALTALAGSCLTGCRSGSTGTAPSWSMFGGSTKDSGKLAAAPPFEGDATKPSANAKPYPTTSTPEGYALEGGNGRSTAAPGATPEAAAIVYGSTPSAAATTDAAIPGGYRPPATPGPASVAGADTPMSSIVPQVGPYAASTPATPAAIETASAPPPADVAPPTGSAFSAGPSAPGGGYAGFPGGPGNVGAPPARVADARGAAGWNTDGAAAPPAAFDPADRYAGEARYGAGSRFSGAAAAPPAWQPSAPGASAPAGAGALDGAAQPGGWPASSASAPPFGASDTSAPAAAGPAPMGSPPPGMPGPAAVPGGPVRRPDPGYRPGGTSSYRRVGDEDQTVVPASFDAGPPPQ